LIWFAGAAYVAGEEQNHSQGRQQGKKVYKYQHWQGIVIGFCTIKWMQRSTPHPNFGV
jgi:hypothetical protein